MENNDNIFFQLGIVVGYLLKVLLAITIVAGLMILLWWTFNASVISYLGYRKVTFIEMLLFISFISFLELWIIMVSKTLNGNNNGNGTAT